LHSTLVLLQLQQPKEPPKRWLEQFENIKQMRSSRDAPVDTMGCERIHDTSAPPEVQRFQILVSLMLSSQVSVFPSDQLPKISSFAALEDGKIKMSL
jgi:hypothetical protein